MLESLAAEVNATKVTAPTSSNGVAGDGKRSFDLKANGNHRLDVARWLLARGIPFRK